MEEKKSKKSKLGQMVGSSSGRKKVLIYRRHVSTSWWLQLILDLST
jgi:hypothetical protein